jgi:hypothetical protein
MKRQLAKYQLEILSPEELKGWDRFKVKIGSHTIKSVLFDLIKEYNER